MIEYVDAQKWYMTFCLNAAPISSRVRFFVQVFLNFLSQQIPFPPAFLVFEFLGLFLVVVATLVLGVRQKQVAFLHPDHYFLSIISRFYIFISMWLRLFIGILVNTMGDSNETFWKVSCRFFTNPVFFLGGLSLKKDWVLGNSTSPHKHLT